MSFLKGNNKKIQEAIDKELQAQDEAYLKDIREVGVKHNRDIGAELRITPNGIFPVPVIKKVEPKVEAK